MRKPGTYGPQRGEAPLCNMHNRYLKMGACVECQSIKDRATRAEKAVKHAHYHLSLAMEALEKASLTEGENLNAT